MTPLDEVIKRIHDLPSLPAVVVELLTSMEQEDIDTHALAGKIALDQSLAAKTLRLANSSFYGMPSTVHSIQQAIAVLGFHSIRTLVTACSVTDSFPASAGSRFDFQGFWRHAVGTAVCAKVLAPHLRQNPETAFIAGLLHDLGILVLATRFPAEYADVASWRAAHDSGTVEAERAVCGHDHAMIGSALCAYWKFPDNIQRAVADHHQGDALAPLSLPLTVHLANTLAHALDLAEQPDDQVPPLSQHAWRAAGLDEPTWLAVFADCEQMFQELCKILVS